MSFYQKIQMDNTTPTRTILAAVVNVVNFLSREMSVGRVPTAQDDIRKGEAVDTNLLGGAVSDQSALELRRAIQYFTATITDEWQMMEIASVYPDYAMGAAYKAGEVFRYGENAVGDAQLYQVLQDHTAAAEWLPDATPSLYKPIGISSDGTPEWVQPIGAADAYNTGDVVMHKGVKYRSTIDGNVWAPDVYPQGWEVVEG